MRIVHWTLSNASGLNRMATNISVAERKLGLDSVIAYTDGGMGKPIPSAIIITNNEDAYNSDIHVGHSFIPIEAKGKKAFVAHGTPEHCVQMAVEQGRSSFAAGNPLMLTMHSLNNHDVMVTFWERHAFILQSLNRKARVEVIPMGVDTSYWKETDSQGKWAGEPSLLTCENPHTIKWPLDLILLWPLVMESNPKAAIHFHYLSYDLHKFFYPIMYANGTAYRSYSSGTIFPHKELRNAFKSVDYYVSPVRYGDHNTVCLEAKASGCKVISYRGNHYADYWLTEGDQREMAEELKAIINGQATPNNCLPVPDISETATKMKELYESL